jgi:hypothetical protein
MLIGFIGSQIGGSGSSADTAPVARSQASLDSELRYTVEEAIRSSMKDPGSADFRNVTVVHKGDTATVCGEVNGKNSFGGYTGYTHFMGGAFGVMLRSEDNASLFVKRWNRRCAESR